MTIRINNNNYPKMSHKVAVLKDLLMMKFGMKLFDFEPQINQTIIFEEIFFQEVGQSRKKYMGNSRYNFN